MLDPIKFPPIKNCSGCGKRPFSDILTRDTMGHLMDGRCNEPTVCEVSCAKCGFTVRSWNLADTIKYWNENNPT